MKNAIKKVVAVAMAFTLLGTGTTIAKTVNPKPVTTLSAHAARCNHVIQRHYITNWKPLSYTYYETALFDEEWQYRFYEDICCRCSNYSKSGFCYRYRVTNNITKKKSGWYYDLIPIYD